MYDKKKIAAKLKCGTLLSISINPVSVNAILAVMLSKFKSLYRTDDILSLISSLKVSFVKYNNKDRITKKPFHKNFDCLATPNLDSGSNKILISGTR